MSKKDHSELSTSQAQSSATLDPSVTYAIGEENCDLDNDPLDTLKEMAYQSCSPELETNARPVASAQPSKAKAAHDAHLAELSKQDLTESSEELAAATVNPKLKLQISKERKLRKVSVAHAVAFANCENVVASEEGISKKQDPSEQHAASQKTLNDQRFALAQALKITESMSSTSFTVQEPAEQDSESQGDSSSSNSKPKILFVKPQATQTLSQAGLDSAALSHVAHGIGGLSAQADEIALQDPDSTASQQANTRVHINEGMKAGVSQLENSANAKKQHQAHAVPQFTPLTSFNTPEEQATDEQNSSALQNLEHSIHVLMGMLGSGVALQAIGEGFKRRFVWTNQAFTDITGYTIEEYSHFKLDDSAQHIIHPDDIEFFFSAFRQHLIDGKPLRLTYRILHGVTQEYVWISLRSAYVGEYENMSLFLCLMDDITEQKHMQENMQRWIKKTELLTAACHELIFEYDCNSDTFEHFSDYQSYVTPRKHNIRHDFCKVIPRSPFIHPDDKHVVINFLNEYKTVRNHASLMPRLIKFRMCNEENNEFIWHACSATYYIDPVTKHIKLLGKVYNIHQYEIRIANLKHANQYDSLTKTLNKKTMEQYCREFLNDGDSEDYALLMIDVDKFKEVNDTYGHAFGDEVLQLIGMCLHYAFRASDLTGRMGGDEFMALLQGVNREQAIELTALYQMLLNRCCSLLSKQYKITCSVGIAFASDHGFDYDALYNAADRSLYVVKERGRGGFVCPEAKTLKPHYYIGHTQISEKEQHRLNNAFASIEHHLVINREAGELNKYDHLQSYNMADPDLAKKVADLAYYKQEAGEYVYRAEENE